MYYYPLLDLKHARYDADQNLADIVRDLETLQSETDGLWPPDAAQVLANIQALRALLSVVFSPALEKAIAQEQAAYEEAAAHCCE